MRTFTWLSFIIIFLVITALPAQSLNEKGVILYFDFDRADGDTVKEMIGGKHNGTLQSGAAITTKTKKYGTGAIQIEGGNAAMEVESFKELEEYQDNTYLFWIYFTDPHSGGWDQILSKPAPGSDRSPGLWVHTEGLGIHYRYNPGNLGASKLGVAGENSVFEQDTWYHIAGVKEDADLRLYVDGEEKMKVGVPAKHDQGVYGLFVGNSPAYAGPAAKFIMDELVVYTRALTKNEVGEIMGGFSQPVDATGKLASTWGNIKRLY